MAEITRRARLPLLPDISGLPGIDSGRASPGRVRRRVVSIPVLSGLH